MARPNLGLLIGVGVAGIAGYGVARLLGERRRGRRPQPDSEPDRPIETVLCDGCGQGMREYEFFCPHCGRSRDTAAQEKQSVKP